MEVPLDPHPIDINREAIKSQVNNKVSYELSIILPHLRSLSSIMTQAPIDNTEAMQEFSKLWAEVGTLIPGPVASSAPSTFLSRPKTPENTVSML